MILYDKVKIDGSDGYNLIEWGTQAEEELANIIDDEIDKEIRKIRDESKPVFPVVGE